MLIYYCLNNECYIRLTLIYDVLTIQLLYSYTTCTELFIANSEY